MSFVNVVALDELLTVGGEKGDKLSLVDTLEDPKAEDPVAAFESEETKYLLAGAINTLPEREKIVVTLYYYEGLTLAEIGRVLGVTESRICQMHTKAVLQLRAQARRAARLKLDLLTSPWSSSTPYSRSGPVRRRRSRRPSRRPVR